jgi:hypothetical protein
MPYEAEIYGIGQAIPGVCIAEAGTGAGVGMIPVGLIRNHQSYDVALCMPARGCVSCGVRCSNVDIRNDDHDKCRRRFVRECQKCAVRWGHGAGFLPTPPPTRTLSRWSALLLYVPCFYLRIYSEF